MFKLLKIENTRMNVPEPEYYTVGATAVKQGELLTLSSGLLVAATTSVDFVALSDGAASAKIPVARVTSDMLFLADTAADVHSATIGSKLKLAALTIGVTSVSAMAVTTADGVTAANNVAVVVDTNGAASSGDPIIVRF